MSNYSGPASQAPGQQQPSIFDQIPTRPDDIPDLNAVSERPDEPVTTGLNLGPGAGPEALGPLPFVAKDPTVDVVKALMIRTRNPDLVRILARLRAEGRE